MLISLKEEINFWVFFCLLVTGTIVNLSLWLSICFMWFCFALCVFCCRMLVCSFCCFAFFYVFCCRTFTIEIDTSLTLLSRCGCCCWSTTFYCSAAARLGWCWCFAVAVSHFIITIELELVVQKRNETACGQRRLATLPNLDRRVHAARYDVRMRFMHIERCTEVLVSIEGLHTALVA